MPTDIATFIHPGDRRLPDAVRELARPCSGLWFAGDPGVLERGVRVGVIGSRHPRGDSLAVARRIARDAARMGCVVVSGLAIGVDGAAHGAALDAGGEAIAVLGSGLGMVHPTRNRDIARTIAGSRSEHGVIAGCGGDGSRPGTEPRGVVFSEYGAGDEPPLPWRFRERNRVIAALCDYLVVVQATPGSGSMLTVDAALAIGVPIGIVPSSVDDPCYAGSVALLGDGADSVVDGASLAARLELHRVVEPGFHRAHRDLGAALTRDRTGAWLAPAAGTAPAAATDPLVDLLSVPRTAEEVAELAGRDHREVRVALMDLEELRDVEHTPDGLWVATGRAG